MYTIFIGKSVLFEKMFGIFEISTETVCLINVKVTSSIGWITSNLILHNYINTGDRRDLNLFTSTSSLFLTRFQFINQNITFRTGKIRADIRPLRRKGFHFLEKRNSFDLGTAWSLVLSRDIPKTKERMFNGIK